MSAVFLHLTGIWWRGTGEPSHLVLLLNLCTVKRGQAPENMEEVSKHLCFIIHPSPKGLIQL